MKRNIRRRWPQKSQPHPAAVTKLPTDLSKVRLKVVVPPPPGRVNNTLVGALLIGIEYVDYAAQQKISRLPGCHADVHALENLLITQYSLPKVQIDILTDETSSPLEKQPTRQNIEAAMQRLWQTAVSSKSGKILFYYSGHGTQQTDKTEEEKDGYDECFVPCDFQEAGVISDDVAASSLFGKLPATVKVVVVVDACNSGSIIDLPWMYDPQTKKWILVGQRQPDCSGATVISLCGCRDDQTSASAFFEQSGWRGALTLTLQQLLQASPWVSTAEVLSHCVAALQKQSFVQNPQLSCSRDNVECLTCPFF